MKINLEAIAWSIIISTVLIICIAVMVGLFMSVREHFGTAIGGLIFAWFSALMFSVLYLVSKLPS